MSVVLGNLKLKSWRPNFFYSAFVCRLPQMKSWDTPVLTAHLSGCWGPREILGVRSHRHHEHLCLLLALTGAQETIAALHFANQLARSR